MIAAKVRWTLRGACLDLCDEMDYGLPAVDM